MARRCVVTGKGVQSGNNVSHANNRTRRRFLPNLQKVTFYSEVLNEKFQMRVSVHGMRTIEHKGGFDAYLRNARRSDLTSDLRRLKARVEAATATQAA